jgi:hypothetical protein
MVIEELADLPFDDCILFDPRHLDDADELLVINAFEMKILQVVVLEIVLEFK